MTLAEMRADVYEIVKDSSISSTKITDLINDALERVAIETQPPDLKRFDVITTVAGQAYTSLAGLAGGFSGKLLKVGTVDSDPLISIFSKLELFVDSYGMLTEAGDVEAVCLEGSVLWYAMIPAVPVLLPIVYIQLPTPLAADDDEPTCIPKCYHRMCLVNRAAEILWDRIEDGLELPVKTNTLNYRKLADDGIVLVKEHFARNRIHLISSMWRY